MAQFTVYRNKSPRSKALFPYLVDVQSDVLEDLQTCVVVPLGKVGSVTKRPVSHLTPVVNIDGDACLLMTPELASMARADLGAAIGSLRDRREVVIAALDFLISGF